MTADIGRLLERLFSLHRFGIRPGLERVSTLAALLGNPERNYPIIHVAGTNGKGSVCSMLAAIFASAGYRVGLYTSPHIRRFNERIKINGIEIGNEDIARIISPLLAEAEKEHTTFFEITTVAAFRYFAEQNVDIAIIETGMGGRLDATNIVVPIASAITSIDLDHTEYLGNTLELIAAEKADIIKRNAPVIVGEPRRELWEIFEETARERLAQAIWAAKQYTVKPLKFYNDFSMMVRMEMPDGHMLDNVECGLVGPAQVLNIATAVATVAAVAPRFTVDESALREGLRNVKRLAGLAGRVELVHHNPPLILDVGHNPACMRNLAKTLGDCGYAETRWQTVFGVMADKDISEMLATLKAFTVRLIAAAPNYMRAMPATELAERARSAGFPEVVEAGSVADAVRIALDTGAPTLIAGSFYLADEALAYLDASAATMDLP